MTATQTSPPRRDEANDAPESISGVVDMVKEYAKQETLGPLKGFGTWLGMGVLGALLLGLGLSLVVLGVLRLIQAEWRYAANGALSWIPYLVALLVAAGFIAIAISRINRNSLNEDQ